MKASSHTVTKLSYNSSSLSPLGRTQEVIPAWSPPYPSYSKRQFHTMAQRHGAKDDLLSSPSKSVHSFSTRFTFGTTKHTHPVTGQRTSSTCSVSATHVQILFINTEVGHLNSAKWLRIIIQFAPVLFVTFTPYEVVCIFKRKILYELQKGEQILHLLW